MRFKLTILSLLMALSGFALELTQVPCGSELTFTATPLEGYHFVGWNDGYTDPVRTIEVYSDTVLIAYFESNCGMYADLPIVARYDWLLMVNAKAVRDMGYTVEPEMVTWFRVVGDPDDIGDPDAIRDDVFMTTGLYLTIDRNLSGTGDYYYVLEGATTANALCTGAMRSQIVHYASTDAPARLLALQPTLTQRGHPIHLTGLNPDSEADIRIYTVTGKRVAEYHSYHQPDIWLDESVGVQGCYEVCVEEDGETTVLRYMVE